MRSFTPWGFVCGLCWLFVVMTVHGGLVFSCKESNDLYRTVKAAGLEVVRCDTPDEAIVRARSGDGVLLLAEGYPAVPTAVTDKLYEAATTKKLRVFVEYPSRLPGQDIPKAKALRFERAVVASEFFGESLPALRILAINGLHVQPVTVRNPHLVAARVAGFDTAVYGLPEEIYPLLYEPPQGGLLVATTQFSRFITARYAPQDAWRVVLESVLGWLWPEEPVSLKWVPTVQVSYDRDVKLPPDAERQAVARGAEWFFKSKLLLDKARFEKQWKTVDTEDGVFIKYSGGSAATPPPGAPVGDGTLGILEAPLSVIQLDGSQVQSAVRRGDCTAESAMALAFGGKILGDPCQTSVAENLLNFYLFDSIACKRERADPNNGAYGLISWGIGSYSWYRANYGDDNARLMLGVLAVAALTEKDCWNDAVMRCMLANLRTSGRFGYRGSRIDIPDLTKKGWLQYFRRGNTYYSAHMESYLWACYLWAYDKTGSQLFYDRAECAIRMMMEQYTDGWHWTNGLAQEKARMLLPLAWLVHVKDTPEHRAWLQKSVDGVVALQASCGAIREEIGILGNGSYPPPKSNADYGKSEASLIQTNGDPVADLLYTVNFAFIGLHEAAAVGNQAAKKAADKLADFLCRIQVRSEVHPSLDGGWFRAFDFKRWEAWASNADAGWGAWAIESGWTQGWIVSTLALRLQKKSLWELTDNRKFRNGFGPLRSEMLPDHIWQGLSPIQHLAFGCPVALASEFASQYHGGGKNGLTDGYKGESSFKDRAWQGFHGIDLDAVVDLGTMASPRKIDVTFLQETKVGIYPPKKVVFSVSSDGRNFTEVQSVTPKLQENLSEAVIHPVSIRFDGRSMRYIRVQARNIGCLPQGHRSEGAPAWLFADEIVVCKPQ